MFLKVIEKHEKGDSYYFLGEIEKIQKNYKQAEIYFTKSAELNNTTRKYRKNSFWNLIVLAEQRGDLDEVVRVCKKMWSTIRDTSARQKVEKLINKFLWSENVEAIAAFKKGVALKKRGKYDEAMKNFQEAVSIDYSFLAPKFEMSLIYYRKEDYSSAAGYLREVVNRISFYAEAHLMLGDIYFRNKSYSYARDHFLKAFEFSFSGKSTVYQISTRIAESSYAAGDYGNAIAYAEKAHDMKRGELKPLLILSAANIKQQKYTDALNALKKAGKIKPGSPKIIYQIGSIYYRQDDSRYLTYFDRLFDMLPPDSRKKSKYNRAFTILAKNHFKNRSYGRTITIIHAFQEDGISFEMTLLLGKSLYHMRQFDKAIDALKTISLSPEDAVLLCKAYAMSRRKEEAKDIIRKYQYSAGFNTEIEKSRMLSRLKKEIENENKERDGSEQSP